MSAQFNSEAQSKNKQFGIFVGLLIITIVVFAFIALNDPDIKASLGSNQNRADSKRSYAVPGAKTNYIQQWIEKSEADLAGLKQDVGEFKGEVKALLASLRSDFKTVKDTVENYSGSQNNVKEQMDKLTKRVDDSNVLSKKDIDNFNKQLKLFEKLDITRKSNNSAVAQPSKYPPPQSFPRVNSIPQKLTGGLPQRQGSVANETNLNDLGVLSSFDKSKKIIKVTFDYSNKKKRLHIRDYIPATSVIKTMLLNGVHAPTGEIAKERPVPMFFQVLDNGSLPNKFKHKVNQCRFMGTGFGDISMERVIVRIFKLVCILKNGEFISVKAKGVVADEQGIADISGKVFDRTGKIIAKSFAAGTAGGFGTALSQSYTTLSTSSLGSSSSVDPAQIGEFGFASGLGSSLEKIADYYLDRAAEIYPIVEVLPGRVIDIELTDDVYVGANLWELK